MTAQVFRSKSVVLPAGTSAATVHVRAGRIERVGAYEDVPEGAPVVEVPGAALMPALVDTHVHVNEPGRTEWEGFATGSAALAAGGGTLFFDMPLNSSPPVLDGPSFDLKLEAAAFLCMARQGSRVDPRFIRHVVSIQRADGGWGRLDTPNSDNPNESSWHSTTLALLLLLHVQFVDSQAPRG